MNQQQRILSLQTCLQKGVFVRVSSKSWKGGFFEIEARANCLECYK